MSPGDMSDGKTIDDPLYGGRMPPTAMRVRATVRRPRAPHSDFVQRLLNHLEMRGFPGSPRYLGVDEIDRDIFSYLPGEVPADLGCFTGFQLTHAARLLRSFHDATADFNDKAAAEVVCHGDPSPCNFVFVAGQPQALIDFDDAHPGSRLEDLGYAAWLWLDIGNDGIAADVQHERLQRFVSDYGLGCGCRPGQLVRNAQARHIANTHLAEHVRRWSRECLEWVVRQGWE